MSSPRSNGTRSHDWAPPLYDSNNLPASAANAIGRMAWQDGYIFDNGGVWSRLHGVYDVREFGARGDDSYTQEYSAFMRALDKIDTAGRGTLLVPAGLYLIDQDIVLPEVDYLDIVGTMGSTLKWNSTTSGSFIRHDSGTDIQFLNIRNLNLDGNKNHITTLNADPQAIRLSHISGVVTIDHVNVFNTADVGITVRSSSGHVCTGVEISDCTFSGIGKDGLQDGTADCLSISPNGGRIRAVTINNNRFWDSNPLKIGSIIPRGCNAILVETVPSSNHYVEALTITGNVARNISASLVRVGGAVSATIVGNEGYSFGANPRVPQGGVHVSNVDYANVVANTLIDTPEQGIFVVESDNVRVADNFVQVQSDINNAGIVVTDNCDNYVIESNTVIVRNTGASARGILVGSATDGGTQNRGRIVRNRVHSTVTATAPLIEVTSSGAMGGTIADRTMVRENELTTESGSSHEGIKIANAATNAFVYDNFLGTNLTYNFGTSTSVYFRETDRLGNTVFGKAALATDATDRFVSLPSMAGTPSGTPTLRTGQVPIVPDTSGNKIWVYMGGSWKSVGVS